MWYQKSRCKWLAHGDQNTKYFHAITKSRRKKHNIQELKDDISRLVTDQKELANLAKDFFQELYRAEPGMSNTCTFLPAIFPYRIDEHALRDWKTTTKEEIRKIVCGIGAYKAPGVDGFQAIFYQVQWEKVSGSIYNWVCDILKGNKSIKEVNKTLICLVPKVERPQNMSQFRPIGLCNVT